MSNPFEHGEFIQAHLFSKDNQLHHVFDVLQWFKDASDDQIKAIFELDRGMFFEGDRTRELAIQVAEPGDDISIIAAATNGDFIVHVDTNTARLWLNLHRPELLEFWKTATPKPAS